jgi:hypothetical protein
LCHHDLAPEQQGEAISFSPDLGSFYTISEGEDPFLYQYKRIE